MVELFEFFYYPQYSVCYIVLKLIGFISMLVKSKVMLAYQTLLHFGSEEHLYSFRKGVFGRGSNFTHGAPFLSNYSSNN